MAHYLVTAKPKRDRLDLLLGDLRRGAYKSMQPFGQALTHALENARVKEDGRAIWEEEDYCTPPLAEERKAVLDEFFEDIETTAVEEGDGWERIEPLPRLFPRLRGEG